MVAMQRTLSTRATLCLNRFDAAYKSFRERKAAFLVQEERKRDQNLKHKEELLEKLRAFVDDDETTTSIEALKAIQEEWKTIGPVPNAHAKTLWANYNALIDRFYDKRSIYFELKELDRRKNMQAKLELCKRAEALVEKESIKDAVVELNELHEEFKHLGPVPKEHQEEVWQRFKSASDKVYERRKSFLDDLKKDLRENLDKKRVIITEVEPFASFNSDRITEWNKKTKEIIKLQKTWEGIGGVPRDHAKEINKGFWTAFKGFFNNKNAFFKKLDGQRQENLTAKEELVTKALELAESDEWESTAEKLKQLQQDWKAVGPVPEKQREEIYQRFKAACDTFFNRRRDQSATQEKAYQENLKLKRDICEQIVALAKEEPEDLQPLKDLQEQYDQIGFCAAQVYEVYTEAVSGCYRPVYAGY